MAEPTIDSANATVPAPIVDGPGSKTPPNPLMNTQNPIGNGPNIKPVGLPGAPQKNPQEELNITDPQLLTGTIDNLVRSVDSILKKYGHTQDDEVTVSEVRIVDYLIESGWSISNLKKIIYYTDYKPKEFFKFILDNINTNGVQKTINLLTDKIMGSDRLDVAPPAPGGPAPGGIPPIGGGAPPPPPPPPAGGPPLGGAPKLSSVIKPDVNLSKILNRGSSMKKGIIIKEGSLVEVPQSDNDILEKLTLSLRKVKSSLKKIDDAKYRFAGIVALKTAGEFGESFPEDGEGGVEDFDLEVGGDMSDVGKILDEIEVKIDEAQSLINEGESELDKEDSDLDSDSIMELDSKIDSGKDILANAKSEVRKARASIEKIAEDAKKKKAPKEDGMKMLGVGKSASEEKKENPFAKKKDEDEDSEKDKDKDKSKIKKDDERSANVDSLVRKIQARLNELRSKNETPKEAQLYPFSNVSDGSAQKVDNINEQNAGQQASTVNSEIKGQPKKDKANPTINAEIGQADLPFKTEGKSTQGSKVSAEVANLVKNSVADAVSKAKLSVELAAQQQLKGLIANPLKTAMVDNLVELGIEKEAASAVVHNAFVDAYEKSQREVMKEAFEEFMGKSKEEFVRIAKFVKDYQVKEASEEVTAETAERDKSASADVPFKASPVNKDKTSGSTAYWKAVRDEHFSV